MTSKNPGKLYHTFSANLKLYKPEHDGKFMCPLCLRIFDELSMHELNVAHIFPHALGGREVTLACGQCNSMVGTEIESYETTRIGERVSMLAETGPGLRIGLEVTDSSGTLGRASAELQIERNGDRPNIKVFMIPRASDPADVQGITDALRRKAAEGSTDWGFRVHRRSRSGWIRGRLTYLHTAYMYLFHRFGYEWVLDPCAADIRHQLRHPDEQAIEVGILPLPELPGDPTTLSLHIIREPKRAQGFLIGIPQLPHTRRMAVWMPFFGRQYSLPEEIGEGTLQLRWLRWAADIHAYLGSSASHMMGHDVVEMMLA